MTKTRPLWPYVVMLEWQKYTHGDQAVSGGPTTYRQAQIVPATSSEHAKRLATETWPSCRVVARPRRGTD